MRDWKDASCSDPRSERETWNLGPLACLTEFFSSRDPVVEFGDQIDPVLSSWLRVL